MTHAFTRAFGAILMFFLFYTPSAQANNLEYVPADLAGIGCAIPELMTAGTLLALPHPAAKAGGAFMASKAVANVLGGSVQLYVDIAEDADPEFRRTVTPTSGSSALVRFTADQILSKAIPDPTERHLVTNRIMWISDGVDLVSPTFAMAIAPGPSHFTLLCKNTQYGLRVIADIATAKKMSPDQSGETAEDEAPSREKANVARWAH
ncbi:MAG: hypothetical protein AAB425_09895 [Bdellovibrionota bacterium]|mgnify:CR=1 FL=1